MSETEEGFGMKRMEIGKVVSWASGLSYGIKLWKGNPRL